MNKILFVNACVRPDSRTYILAQSVLKKLHGKIEEVNLEREDIKPLNWWSLQERDAYVKSKKFSAPMFQYAKQFAEADEIVIAAPYWNLAFPATVRVYFEAVTVNGLTFMYTPKGCPTGLCKAKRIIYVTTAGGTIEGFNLGFDYIKALSQMFYGIQKVMCYKAENLDIKGADVEAIIEKSKNEINYSGI